MRLKSLRLAGFKSFANPTTFTFNKNITAIVGPNGCGKSNVIDAIRWVLGETSAKQLRGGAMSDVIFAGTQEKSAKSLASVELTFEHTQDEQNGIRHELNLYHELSIRRQVNKDGKSDYFINGTRCRRRDVIDIFLGTGLGSRSYAVIEQGMIGRIVDSNPTQLREFIEEGAGISRYQARRLETHKKLTQSKENLDRLNDLKTELEKQQQTLSKQAETAKKHNQLTQQLQVLEQDIAINQLYSTKYSEHQQKQKHQILEQELNNHQNQLNTTTIQLEKLNNRVEEQQWLKDDARDKHHDEQLKLQQVEHSVTQHKTSIEPLIDKQNKATEQSAENQQQREKLLEKLAFEQEQLNKITPQLTELKNRKANTHKNLEPFIQQSQQLRKQRDNVQSTQYQQEKEHALAEQAKQRMIVEQQKLAKKQDTWQNSQQQLEQTADVKSIEQDLNSIKNHLTSVLQRHDDGCVQLEEEQATFNKLKANIQDVQLSLQTQEKQQTKLTSEYNTLHSLVYPPKQKTDKKENQEHTSDDQHPNNLTQLAREQLQSFDRFSDTIELTKQGQLHAEILDTWLALCLDGLLIDTNNKDDNNKNWLELLKTDAQNNKETLNANVLLNVSCNAFNTSLNANTNNTASTFDCSQYSSLIPLQKLIKSPKITLIQSVYLYCFKNSINSDKSTDNNEQSITVDNTVQELTTIIEDMPDGSFIITDTGWLAGGFGCIHISQLTSSGDSHFLRQRESQRTRLTELEEELDGIDTEVDEQQKSLKNHQSRHDEQHITVEELTAQVKNLQTASHEHKQKITELTASFSRHKADSERLNAEKQLLATDKTALEIEESELTTKLSKLNTQLPAITSELKHINEQLTRIFQQRNHIENESREIEGALQSTIMQEQELVLSIKHTQNQTEQLQKQLNNYSDEQSTLTLKIEKLQQDLPSIEKKVQAQQVVCYESTITLEEYQTQLSELQTGLSTERECYNQEQINVAKQQQLLAQLTTQLAIAKERLTEACSRVDSLANLLDDSDQSTQHHTLLTVSSASLLTDFILHKGYDNFDEQTETTKQKQRQLDYQALQMQIGRIGAVNLVAVTELEQVTERLEPLTTQTEDILASITKLTDAIATIDIKTKELFLQTLDSVNKDLLHLFNKVFGGGQATLTLIDDEKFDKKDAWRAGLELMAQPKGKKNSRLAVLSGGEKTLTALSLIFAIFKQHPAPFCVLDEVDAPLDDANVGRFTGLIEELATDLQFIFISHNKLSMQIADELKGITMPNAGISSLVSVSLDEAEQYIDSNA